jgi:hypothetical protein
MNFEQCSKQVRGLLLSAFIFTGLACGHAVASDSKPLTKSQKKYFTIASVEVVEEPGDFDVMNVKDCDQRTVKRQDLTSTIDWDMVVNWGEKIWTVIEKNAPKVTTEYQTANAVPSGLKAWEDLECWRMPQAKNYRVTYKNVYGAKVVDFAYQVHFTHGGQLDGKGLYLSQVTIVPTNLSVSWGYTFDAKVKINNVTNAGTRSSPVAAIQMSLNWSVKTVFKYIEGLESYYVRGDGLFHRL